MVLRMGKWSPNHPPTRTNRIADAPSIHDAPPERAGAKPNWSIINAVKIDTPDETEKTAPPTTNSQEARVRSASFHA